MLHVCSTCSVCDLCGFEVVVRKIDDYTPNLEAAELQVRCLFARDNHAVIACQ